MAQQKKRQGGMLESIERHLLRPLFYVMIGGLLVRTVALIVAAAIPYASWDLMLRLGVELVAAVGMVGLSEVIMSHSAAMRAQFGREIADVRGSPKFRANEKLKPERFKVAQMALDHARDQAIRALKDQSMGYRTAMYVCAAITLVYGSLFALTVMGTQTTLSTAATEVISVVCVPFFNWYVSSMYVERRPDPRQQAQDIALETVDARLLAAKARFSTGDETDEDRVLLKRAVADHGYHSDLVRALMRPASGVEYMTTPELYTFLGADTPTEQARIRKRVRAAGEAIAHGVLWDEDKGQWLTPDTSIKALFGDLIAGTVQRRTQPSEPRAQRGVNLGNIAALLDLRASRERTEGDGARPVAAAVAQEEVEGARVG